MPGVWLGLAELVSAMVKLVVPNWPKAGVKVSASRSVVTVLAGPVRVMAPLLGVLWSVAAFGSESVPLVVVLGVTVTVSVGRRSWCR